MSDRHNPQAIDREIRDAVPTPQAPDLPTSTTEGIAERLTSDLRPVSPLPSRAALAGGFLAIFCVVAAVITFFVGARGAEAMALPQLIGVLAAVAVATGLVAASLAGDMPPGQRRFVRPGFMIGGILITLGTLVAVLFPWESGPVAGWHCFRGGFLSSLPAIALVLLLARSRGSILSWASVGSCAGLLGGLAGLAVIHIGCPMINAPHIALGHLTVPLAGALAGWTAGKAARHILHLRPQA